MLDRALSRRTLLAGAGSAAALMMVSACAGPGQTKATGLSPAIMPGTAPEGWKTVLAAVNKKMQKDIGITLDGQFISWANFIQQAQLKFTAGEKFDTSLSAIWTGMPKLEQDGALADLTSHIDRYPNLKKMIAPEAITANLWDGHLWGIPQVNTAARLQHFAVRQDIADKLGYSEITSYAELEKFLYDVKQKVPGMTPWGGSTNSTWYMVVPGPVGMFNEASWEDPHYSSQGFSGNVTFVLARDAKQTGRSKPVPYWEDPTVVESLRRIRKYAADGIMNKDGITSDASTIQSRWANGEFATTWAITDGTTSNFIAALRKNVPNGQISDVVPIKGGLTSKPNQTFQADNLVAVNANGGDVDRALAVQDWLSIAENHNLIQYGIEGKDWKPVGDDKWQQISGYTFPGFALSWRTPLELKTSNMSESEQRIYDWAQKYENFTTDPFSSFIVDNVPVAPAVAQMTQALTQYGTPLFYGAVDVDKGLSALKKAADAAGIEKLQAEMEKQADAYLKKHA